LRRPCEVFSFVVSDGKGLSGRRGWQIQVLTSFGSNHLLSQVETGEHRVPGI
jgi:hypothetical protein